jgi:archaellum biogenesis protein FlaJ (TadC family)
MKTPLLPSFGAKVAEGDPDIETILEKANQNIRGEVFYTGLLVAAIIAGFVGFLIGTLINSTFLSDWVLPVKIVVWIAIPVLFAAFTYAIYSYLPRNKISERKKDIDKNISYATNYMAAMASADVTPSSIFRGLAEQDILFLGR